MKKKIEEIIKNAILSLQKEGNIDDFKESEVDYAVNDKFGEYTTNIAMKVIKSTNKSPMEIAEEIRKKIISDDFEKIEVSTPGYINFYLSKKYLQSVVEKINSEKENFGKSEIGKGLKVNNEFISANPTGPLHLGNGRGGFYGDVLSNVLKKSDYKVTREYFLNDVGEQTLKLAHSFRKDDQTVYVGEYIDELRDKHKEIFETSSIQASAVPLSAAVTTDYIKPAVLKMQINFDVWMSEKSLHDKGYVDKAIAFLKDKNLTYEKEGALWLKTTEFGDDKDRVLIKKDGQKTYFASDCGYILNKIKRGFDKIIEIWGADHHGYISRFKAVAEALGFKGEVRFVIVQLVRLVKGGKEIRMSKRAGNVVYIDELINKVGHDVARFFFLMYSPDTHMNFDLKLAEDRSQKNPVYYVQYAHARIASILRKAQEKNLDFTKADLKKINQKKELNLIQELDKFPDLVKEIGETLEVHKLSHYAIKLADKFHSFYNELKVIDETDLEISKARLKLVNAVKIVLAETLRLIGVEAPERM
jgi:arginyl-tRNA synthetase